MLFWDLWDSGGEGNDKGGGKEGITRKEGKRALQGRRGRGHYKGGGEEGITRKEGMRV